MLVLVLMTALTALGVPTTSMFAILGAAGLAVGLALKDAKLVPAEGAAEAGDLTSAHATPTPSGSISLLKFIWAKVAEFQV